VPGNRERMPGVRMNVLWVGLAAVALAGALNACGGSLGGGGTAGTTGAAGSGSQDGTAGTTGAGGTAGPGGTTGTGGSGISTGVAGTTGNIGFGEPACVSPTIGKGAPCGPADEQFCYKTCGPERSGVKSETCTIAGTYAEMSGCTFDPTRDYSCYKIPVDANAACPAGQVPMASAPCEVPPCLLCNGLQGVVGGQYFDSTGTPKIGWCVCSSTVNSVGVHTWSCASDTAWPCPLGSGC
jgi:hypothetical protein